MKLTMAQKSDGTLQIWSKGLKTMKDGLTTKKKKLTEERKNQLIANEKECFEMNARLEQTARNNMRTERGLQ